MIEWFLFVFSDIYGELLTRCYLHKYLLIKTVFQDGIPCDIPELARL